MATPGNDSAHAKFKIVMTGTLEFGIRSAMVAMEPDSTLLLATPADLVVHKGAGTAVITAADSGAVLVVTSLDRADSTRVRARGHAVLVTRPDTTRRLTAVPVIPTRSAPEISR